MTRAWLQWIAGFAVLLVIASAEFIGAQSTAVAVDAVLIKSARPTEKVRARPIALVYRGPASCPGCSEAAAQLLRSTKYRFRVSYIGPQERRKFTRSAFSGVALYVQPGGDSSVTQANRQLGSRARVLIKNYVRRGGRYLGICQGGYLAGSQPGMRLLNPGDSGQYIKTSGASTRSSRDTVIPIRWGGKKYPMYFQDGPFFTARAASGGKVLARYTNGRIAALSKHYGRGLVTVVGPHPEAPASWYRAIGARDYSSRGNRLGRQLVRSALGRR